MKPRINLFLTTSTTCNVRCKTCPTGRKEHERGGVMSLDMLGRILDKCLAESHIISVQLYRYNEPLLIPHMPQMVRACHERGLPVFLSSNLVNFKNGPAVLAEEPETFLISVSGFTQLIYERSHKDGDIEKVKEHMAEIACIKSKRTHVQVSWHRYRYNEHESHLMEDYSKLLGFSFVPYCTSLLPQDKAMEVWSSGVDDPAGEDLIVPVKATKEKCADRRWWPCIFQNQILSVNPQGRVLNCCNLTKDSNLRGSLFDTTVAEIFRTRKSDSDCRSCKSVGGHVYAMQDYTRAKYSPLKLAEIAYRKLGLAGRSAGFSSWVTHNLYIRPQETATM